jgi:hypothetical protein
MPKEKECNIELAEKTSGRAYGNCLYINEAPAPKQSCIIVHAFSCVHCILVNGSTKVLFLFLNNR